MKSFLRRGFLPSIQQMMLLLTLLAALLLRLVPFGPHANQAHPSAHAHMLCLRSVSFPQLSHSGSSLCLCWSGQQGADAQNSLSLLPTHTDPFGRVGPLSSDPGSNMKAAHTCIISVLVSTEIWPKLPYHTVEWPCPATIRHLFYLKSSHWKLGSQYLLSHTTVLLLGLLDN